MKTPLRIHIANLDRLYNDGLVTDKEYKSIMERITAERLKERAESKNG